MIIRMISHKTSALQWKQIKIYHLSFHTLIQKLKIKLNNLYILSQLFTLTIVAKVMITTKFGTN